MLALACAANPAFCGAQAVSWAHQNGSLQSNGSITVKSQSGGAYAGQVNPAGAVAKANQSAVTQPPTVIIQATSGAYVESVPLLVAGSSLPACPSGYTAAFTKTGTSNLPNAYVNVAGSRWTLGSLWHTSNGRYVVTWFSENYPTATISAYNMELPTIYISGSTPWAAVLCTK